MKADKVINIHNLLSNWIKFLLSLIKLNLYLQDTFHLQDYRLHGFTNNKRIQEFQEDYFRFMTRPQSLFFQIDYSKSRLSEEPSLSA